MKQFVSFFGDRSPIFENLNKRAKEYAATKGFAYKWVPQIPFNKEEVVRHLQESDVGLIDVENYDDSIFSQIRERCRLLVRFGVGFDKVNLPDATRNGICVCRTTGANSAAVAEMALTLLLAAQRGLRMHRKVVDSGVWQKNVGHGLMGKTVGIIGFGAVGQILAKLLAGFGCELLAFDPFPNVDAMAKLGVKQASLDDIIERADAISIHSPYNEQTHHMFNAEVFERMKQSAVLVCTARGNVIDEDALYRALASGQIAAAGLDVFAQEPLPISSPLLELDNCILTPHVASQTVEALWAIYKKAIDIAEDFFAGREIPPADLLNPEFRDGL